MLDENSLTLKGLSLINVVVSQSIRQSDTTFLTRNILMYIFGRYIILHRAKTGT